MVTCTKCKESKNINLFVKRSLTKINTGLCKQCKAKQDKEYTIKYREKYLKYQKEYNFYNKEQRKKTSQICRENLRYGFNVTEWIKDKQCSVCNMTDNQHHIKYNERLHLHHKKNNGRHNDINDKDIKGMQVLCRSCHVGIDNREHKIYTKERSLKIWNKRRLNANKNN